MGAYENLGIFSENQDIDNTTEASTNIIDLALTNPQFGVGKNAPFLCIRSRTVNAATTDTLSIELQMDDNASFTSAQTVFIPFGVGAGDAKTGASAASAQALATHAKLATGAWIYRGQLPYEITERYIRLYYNSSVNAGHFYIDAWLSAGPPSDDGVQVVASNVGFPT